jgi:hypothetical protein
MANGGGPFGIGNQILKGFIGNDTLRDYTHASKTFTSNSYELKPRYKFLYHVSFTINTEQIPYLRGVFGNNESSKLSLLVKTVDLPKFQVQTEVLNQYNRKRIIQKKIEYQPVNLVFHDDSGDNARRLWYYYYSYYYKDPSQQYLAPNNTNGSVGASANRQAGFGYNTRDIYSDVLQVKDWGYSGEAWQDGTPAPGSNNSGGKPAFFSDIRIYGLDQRKFAEYVLINPVIQSWNHDTYDYSQGNGTMSHTVSIQYETVKYYSGAVGGARPDTNVEGFANPTHYDTTLSPISRPGGNSTIFGQGGLLDAGIGILGDLQGGGPGGLIGAAQTAMRVANTFKGKNIASLAKNEAVSAGVNQLIQSIPGATRQVMNRAGGVYIPTPQKTPQTASPTFNNNNTR